MNSNHKVLRYLSNQKGRSMRKRTFGKNEKREVPIYINNKAYTSVLLSDI